MSKKHFQMMADIISKIKDKKEKETVALGFIMLCEASNPQFDVKRFRKACGLA